MTTSGNIRPSSRSLLLGIGFVLILWQSLSFAAIAMAQSPHSTVLETLELSGTDRVDAETLADELGIRPGDPLSDDFVTSTRSRILSLGIFRSCFLAIKKGSAPGKGRLIITVEDEGTVVGPWSMGGVLAMTYGETKTASSGLGSSPLGYRLGLVGRNIGRHMHRASILGDVDGLGVLRESQLAYGLPRFTAEGVQFDAELSVVDPSRRYLDTLGFGGRSQAIWNRTLAHSGTLRYGVGMYLNQREHYKMGGYPAQVVGPKVGYAYEGRLMRFFPGQGSHGDISTILALQSQKNSVVEGGVGHTFAFGDAAYWTFDAKGIIAGAKSRGVRGETRFDLPLRDDWSPGSSAAAGLFVRLRTGNDLTEELLTQGSAVILGLRYHSDGFIAEVALQITRSPEVLSGRDIDQNKQSNGPEDLAKGDH